MTIAADARQVATGIASRLSAYTIYSVTYFQKFSVPGSGRIIWLSQALLVVILLGGAWRGAFRAAAAPMLFFLVLVFTLAGCASITAAWTQNSNTSLPSIVLLVFSNLFYCFRFKRSEITLSSAADTFQHVALVLAGIAIVQFALQFVIGKELAFPIDFLIPPEFLISNYNNLNSLEYGSTTVKANAVFLIEPSVLNQTICLALVGELLRPKQKTARLAVFVGALLVTFSGTGLLVLGVVGPLLLIAKRKFLILAVGGLAAFVVFTFGDQLGLSVFLGRTTEFFRPGTSGYARFVSGFMMIDDYVLNSPLSICFGNGPGTARTFFRAYSFEVFAPTFIRLILEYGFIGGGLYVAFMTYVIFRSGVAPMFSLAMWMTFMVMGDYASVPFMHGIILAVIAWPAANKQNAKLMLNRSWTERAAYKRPRDAMPPVLRTP